MKNWVTKSLGEICSIFEDGDWIESKDQSSEGVRLIQTGNVGNGFFKDRGEKARYISEATFKRLRCTEIVEGDCLISRLPDPVGRACIIPDTGEKMITAVDCTIIRFKPKEILSAWFLLYSLSHEYQSEVSKQVSGATRQRISRKNLGLIKIPLPPIPEQQHIVAILDVAFAAIAKAKANAEQNLKNAKELFESYLQNVFENKGEDWEHTRLGDICQINDGTHFSPKNTSAGEFMYITAKNIKTNYIDLTKISYISKKDHKEIYARCSPVKGDVLYIKDGATAGIAAINTLNEEFSLLSSVALLKCSSKILNTFLVNYMNSTIGRKNFLGYIGGAAITRLTLVKIKNVCLSLPSIKEQKIIVQKLVALSAETQKLENIYQQKINDLEELKKSILQKAFSGELITEKADAV